MPGAVRAAAVGCFDAGDVEAFRLDPNSVARPNEAGRIEHSARLTRDWQRQVCLRRWIGAGALDRTRGVAVHHVKPIVVQPQRIGARVVQHVRHVAELDQVFEDERTAVRAGCVHGVALRLCVELQPRRALHHDGRGENDVDGHRLPYPVGPVNVRRRNVEYFGDRCVDRDVRADGIVVAKRNGPLAPRDCQVKERVCSRIGRLALDRDKWNARLGLQR
mmetsp:Transcript_75825/g.216156  ORF Transcript_75825/g.216156 Transcript_75825/m.216156 type:complete len:219 (-) Transcript_75825:6168-6824(-)